MTIQDSDSDLAGKMGASLTAPVPHVHTPPRGTQSSGFFDLNTLYTMQVARARPMPPPLPAMRARPRPLAPLAPVLEAPEPVVLPRATPRAQPIGWFAVFVAWLATTTLAGLCATQIPGHLHARAATTTAPTPTPTPTPAPTPTTTTTTASATATSISVDALPIAGAAPLPRALPRTPSHARHVAPPPPPAAASPAEPSLTPTPARPPAPTPAPAPPAAKAAPASTANMSLEDLIRHEVAAEQKRLHPPAAQ